MNGFEFGLFSGNVSFREGRFFFFWIMHHSDDMFVWCLFEMITSKFPHGNYSSITVKFFFPGATMWVWQEEPRKHQKMDRVVHVHRQYNNAIMDVGWMFLPGLWFHPGTDGLNDLKYNSKQIGSGFKQIWIFSLLNMTWGPCMSLNRWFVWISSTHIFLFDKHWSGQNIHECPGCFSLRPVDWWTCLAIFILQENHQVMEKYDGFMINSLRKKSGH